MIRRVMISRKIQCNGILLAFYFLRFEGVQVGMQIDTRLARTSLVVVLAVTLRWVSYVTLNQTGSMRPYYGLFGGSAFSEEFIEECMHREFATHDCSYPSGIRRLIQISRFVGTFGFAMICDGLTTLLFFCHAWTSQSHSSIILFLIHPFSSGLASVRSSVTTAWALLLAGCLSDKSIVNTITLLLLSQVLPVSCVLAMAIAGQTGMKAPKALIDVVFVSLIGVAMVSEDWLGLRPSFWLVNQLNDLSVNPGLFWALLQQTLDQVTDIVSCVVVAMPLVYGVAFRIWSKVPRVDGFVRSEDPKSNVQYRQKAAVVLTWCSAVLLQPLPSLQDYLLLVAVILACIDHGVSTGYLEGTSRRAFSFLYGALTAMPLLFAVCYGYIDRGTMNFTLALCFGVLINLTLSTGASYLID